MPYKGEYANKASHFDIVKNQDIIEFLEEQDFIRVPSDEFGEQLVQNFINVESCIDSDIKLPKKIIASDGSLHESSINKHLPSTKVGYIKIGTLIIDIDLYDNLTGDGSSFVDPFKVAKLKEDNNSLTFTLPSSNLKTKGKNTVRDSFRYNMDKELLLKGRSDENDYKTSLRSTLFKLASIRPGDKGTNDANKLILHRCPNENCDETNITLYDQLEKQFCKCGEELYPSDVLRIWEEVDEYQSNYSPMTRFMAVLEHLLPIHYIRILGQYQRDIALEVLDKLAVFIDGPLAVFGPAAWLHGSIMRYLYDINEKLIERGHNELLIIGLQKTGTLVEFTQLIDKYTKNNTIYSVDDTYRFGYILPNRSIPTGGFGAGTYYGQDFIYKSKTGNTYVFGLPYPFRTKGGGNNPFINEKVEIDRYHNLSKAINLINKFECDLYENSITPISLAHKYTAISLTPGSKILDILTEKNLFK